MNFSRLGSIVLLLFTPSVLLAQLHHNLFPTLSGAALEQALVVAYKPATVLNYAQARDTLFSKVYLEQDSVVCIYTQHKVYLPPNSDPTQAVYLNGMANGINTEHAYPQSKGASEANGKPYSDMHHLYPTRIAVNNARGDLPFKELPDSQTTKWYYRDQTLNSAPPLNIRDLYSELSTDRFEVRENQKGNLARAVFYFFTMYRTEALTADPLFFETQRSSLCAWHYADPVDSLEYVRTHTIAKYQSGKANPFVLDCSLAERTYCGSMAGTCPTLPTVSVATTYQSLPMIEIYPNPAHTQGAAQIHLPQVSDFQVLINDMAGNRIWQSDRLHGTEARVELPDMLPGGMYEVQVQTSLGLFSKVKWVVVR